MFQGLANFFEADNSLDIITTQRQDLQILELRQIDNSFDLVCRQAKLLAALQLVQRVVHLVNEWKLANKFDFERFSCNLPCLLLPLLNGISA